MVGMVPTMPLPFADVPDIHGNGAPARSKDDPSYQRPLVNRRAQSPLQHLPHPNVDYRSLKEMRQRCFQQF